MRCSMLFNPAEAASSILVLGTTSIISNAIIEKEEGKETTGFGYEAVGERGIKERKGVGKSKRFRGSKAQDRFATRQRQEDAEEIGGWLLREWKHTIQEKP